jgi:hypothetical protein
MPFCVELSMDDSAAGGVRAVWQSLVDAGVPSLPLSLGAQPHVSLGAYEFLDSSLATKQLDNFARQIRTLRFELDAA